MATVSEEGDEGEKDNDSLVEWTADEIEEIVVQSDPTLLEELNPEERQRVLQVVRQAASSFSGPLPPPRMLGEYDSIVPGAAQEILNWVKGQTEHRHKLEISQ